MYFVCFLKHNNLFFLLSTIITLYHNIFRKRIMHKLNMERRVKKTLDFWCASNHYVLSTIPVFGSPVTELKAELIYHHLDVATLN
jgi:hypothetical protein